MTNSSNEKELISEEGLAAAGEIWGQRASELARTGHVPVAWTDSPLVNTLYIHPLISGNPDVNWLGAVGQHFFPTPVAKALSLGAGGGGLERHGVSINIARQFDAFDVSKKSIELAQQLAAEHGWSDRIRYHVADLNRHVFPANEYDVVFASQSLHHIHALEHVFAQVERTLKRGGRFIMNEFVGPNQFQWTAAQMEHAQRLLEQIPKRLRMGIQSSHLKERVDRQTVEQMTKVDPTEAIRSEDIVPCLQQRFVIEKRVDFGGTVLNLVLEDIMGNFRDTPEDLAVLQRLFDAEQRLLRSGELTSDFTVLIARHRHPA